MKHLMSTLLKFKGSLLLLLLISFIHFPNVIFSQGSTDYLINPKGDTIVIEAIPILEINTRTEDVNTRMNRFPDVIRAKKDIATLDSLLNVARDLLDIEESRITDSEEFFTMRNIDDLNRQWKEYNEILSKWQNTLTNRIHELEENVFDASSIKLSWQKTEKEARKQNVLKETQDRVKDIIDRTKKIEKDLKNRQDTVLLYQNQITDFHLRVDKVLQTLKEKRTAMQSEYFIQDSPALWQANDSTVIPSQVRDQFKLSVKENIRQIDNFVQTNKTNSIVQLIVLILLLVLFYILLKVFKVPEEDEKDPRVARTRIILKMFPASAFLVALVLSLVIFSNFPAAVREFSQLLMLIPAIILLPKLVHNKLKPLLYSLIVLFLIDEVQIFFVAKSMFFRILLMVEEIFMLWLVIKFANKNSFFFKDLNPSFKQVIGIFKPIYIVLMVIAFLTNIFGFVNMAMLLSNTVINSILIAVLLAVLLIVLDSLFFSLFTTRFFMYSHILKNRSENLLKGLHKIFKYFAIYLWIRSVLISLGIFDQVAIWFTSVFNYTWKLDKVSISFGNILAFFIIILITYVVTKLIRIVLEEEIFPRVRLSRGVPGAISMLVSYTIVAFGMYVALSAAGIELNKFGLIASALGVGIGFGLQGIVNNFIAGLILSFERPIQKGDTIEVGTLLGDVTGIGVRASTIRTYDGSEVIVPNGNLISNEVINWTLSDRRRRRIVPVSVAYGSKPREVMEILSNVASKHPEVQDFPKPWPLFDGFGDSSLNFRILFWVDFDRGMSVQSEVAMNIYDALEKANIHIPFPQQDLHIKSFDPTVQEIVYPWKKGNKKT